MLFLILLELIFSAQVPSAKSAKIKPRKIKLLHGSVFSPGLTVQNIHEDLIYFIKMKNFLYTLSFYPDVRLKCAYGIIGRCGVTFMQYVEDFTACSSNFALKSLNRELF